VTTTPPERRSPVIREAVSADLLDVLRIERASFPQPWPFGAFNRFVGRPGFLVAERPPSNGSYTDGGDGDGVPVPGEIVGYVVADTVTEADRPVGHIKDLAVRPDVRGRGVGSTLLERALGVLGATDAGMVKLEVRESNEEARSLYRAFGFTRRRTREHYYADGEDAIVMVAPLE